MVNPDIIDLFSKEGRHSLLLKGLWGLEKESLRVDGDGNLALTRHPAAFGDKIENPEITTDFSESQIEMVTPPLDSPGKAYRALLNIQNHVENNLRKEYLWPFSMPSKLPDEKQIPIARFNKSDLGRKNEIYRHGLSARYGKKMQLISGIHYNFSFHDTFWDFLYNRLKPPADKQTFINNQYFSLARNYLRYRWLLVYLFGASPAADESFASSPDDFEKIGRHSNHAVSLRMSPLGYSINRQKGVHVSYDSLEAYIAGLEKALQTESDDYQKMRLCEAGRCLKLDSHILQKDSEYYSSIRFKSEAKKGESHLERLKANGIKYIEIRSVDINPFDKAGVSLEQLYFYHVFLLYCLFHESGLLSQEESGFIEKNDELTALAGRKEGLELFKSNGARVSLTEWAKGILAGMIPIAELLGQEYIDSVLAQMAKIQNKSLLPSSRIMDEISRGNETFIQYGLKKAWELRSTDHNTLEELKMNSFDGNYQDLELSTQILIHEALQRNIKVDVLDRHDNFIRLIKGTKVEHIKQATRTSADTYIAPLIMENKHVTKIVLEEQGVQVPHGKLYTDINEAMKDHEKFRNTDIVVKPNNTNFGIGVSLIKKGVSRNEYEQSLKTAFENDTSVIVEEFIRGREYRFLVIGNRVIAVLHRMPANVTGDGIHTIEELAAIKNRNPLRGKGYKTPLEFINLGNVELEFLKDQGKDIQYMPGKDERIFLRKNSNISTGGDSIDFTDDVHEGYKEIAVQAAKAAGAKICGADIIIGDTRTKPSKGNYAVIELNFNPALHIHSFPYQGQNRHPEKAVLDLLGF